MAIIEVAKRDRVEIWTLNHPPVNAISMDVLTRLGELLDGAQTNDEVRAIVITGAGYTFAAGADVAGFMKMGGQLQDFLRLGTQIFTRVEQFGKPIVAAVNGVAFGGGNELAMATDIRIASSRARFGQPEVNLGIIPGWGGTFRMAQLIGRAHAANLILTGEPIEAADAYRLGLVEQVVEPDLLLDYAVNKADRLASLPPLALAAIKRLLTQAQPPGASERETTELLSLMTTQDAMEGVLAFMQKRRPRFKGK